MANQYGDISPRTAAYAAEKMLERALPHLAAAKFGQLHAIPRNKTNTLKFRRYTSFVPNTVPLVEGVTPLPDSINFTDVTAVLQQFGRRTQISDVIADTHEDQVLTEYATIMGEVAGQTQELVVFNAIKAGTNVFYNNGAARTDINTEVNAAALNRVIRQLKRQNAKQISKMLAGSDRVGTTPIRSAFVGLCHPDLQTDLENVPGFTVVANYGTTAKLCESEIGSYRDIRFVTSTLYSPFISAGAASTTMLSNGQTPIGSQPADVYPLIVVSADAYATVALAGDTAITPIVLNPTPSDSDVMAQRGHVAFKMYSTCSILNDAWIVRLECAAKA